MIKVGVSTATFFLKILTEDTFSVIQRCGGEVAEVFLSTLSEYEPKFIDLLLERKGELDIYSVHALNTQFEPQLFNGAARTRADAEDIFLRVLEAGKRLGAKVYTFHGICKFKRGSCVDPEKSGKRLEELALMANDFGVTLCLENVHWAMFDRPEYFQAVRDLCPHVGCVLDIKQARQSDRDWREYIDVMGDRLKNVHVSDVDKDGNIVMVGQGIFPFDALVKKLEEGGYDGPLQIEQYSRNYADCEEVAAAVKYLKKIVGGNKQCN